MRQKGLLALLSLVWALVWAAGCTEARTEVIVVVNKYGITIGKDVDGLQLIVKNAPALDPIYDSGKHPLCPDDSPPMTGCWTLPVTATLVPGPGNPNDKVYVQVLGLRGGAQVIGDAASFEFLKHVSQRLDFVLYGNCLDVDCTSEDAACNYNGECEPISPTSFNGEPQLDGLPPGLIPDLGSNGSGDLAGADLAGADLHMSMPQDLMSLDLRGIDLAGLPPIDMAYSDMSLLDGPAATSPWVAQTSNTTNRLRAVWGWDSMHAVAVGDAGTIVYTVNGGNTWNVAPSPSTANDLYGVWGTSLGSELFAVGDSGTIVMSNDGGQSWSISFNPWSGTIDLRGVWGDSAGANFYVGGKGSLLGVWNGVSWTTLCGGASNDSMNLYDAVWSSGAGVNLFLAGLKGGTTLVAVEDLTQMCGMMASASPTGSPMFDLSCVQSCPSAITNPLGPAMTGLSGTSTGTATVCGAAGDIYNCGPSLCSSTPGGSGGSGLNAVWTDAVGSTAFAVGVAGTIRRLTGGGWMGELSPTVSNLNGVWGTNGGGPVWAVGDSGKIFKR
jgi:hypothetical protein